MLEAGAAMGCRSHVGDRVLVQFIFSDADVEFSSADMWPVTSRFGLDPPDATTHAAALAGLGPEWKISPLRHGGRLSRDRFITEMSRVWPQSSMVWSNPHGREPERK